MGGPTYKLPIGPIHVGLKEPVWVHLELDGERVVGARVRSGHVHRGIEFMGRERNLVQIIYLAERICGICSFTHVAAFLQAVEAAAGIDVPRRARFIRTIVLELERIHSHLLWAGVAAYTMGFDSLFHLGMELREKVQDVLEALTGNRVNYGVGQIGGVRRDVTPAVARAIREMVDYYRLEFPAFEEIFLEDPSVKARMRGVGTLPREDAIRLCAVGPTARASGVRVDERWGNPYEAYAEVEVRPIVPQDFGEEAVGDVFDRLLVRLKEVWQSMEIIQRCLEGLPEGPILFEPKIARLLTYLKKAEGEGLGVVEGPRGNDTHYVKLVGGREEPSSWKVRAPTYANAMSWPVMFRDQEIADVPLIVNSIDPCISCMDRMLFVDRRSGASGALEMRDLIKLCVEKTRKVVGR